jgi:hypothetical protein
MNTSGKTTKSIMESFGDWLTSVLSSIRRYICPNSPAIPDDGPSGNKCSKFFASLYDFLYVVLPLATLLLFGYFVYFSNLVRMQPFQ